MLTTRVVVTLAAALCTLALPKLAPAKPRGLKHLLVVSWTTGFRHQDTIGTPEQDGPAQGIVKAIGDSSHVYDVDYCRTQDDVTKMLTLEGLKKYDGVFFLNTTGNLHIPDLHAFLDWIKAGHAFIGVHSAGDTYHPSDTNGDTGYIDMIGGEFKTHGAQSTVEVTVDDPTFPAVKELAPKFSIHDEVYEFRVNNRDKVHVLLSMKSHPMDGHPNAGEAGDYLVSWCKMYGKGHVYYCALGHRPDVWAQERYQKMLLSGVKWALGLVKGGSTVGNPLP